MSGLAVVSPTAFHLSARHDTERVEGELVSSNYFDVLGVTAAQGRLIAPTDDRSNGADAVAVVSYRLWQRRFAGDASVIGTTIKLDGRDFVVIGVANEQFSGVRVGTPRDIWIPLLTLRESNPRARIRSAPRLMARDVRPAQAGRHARTGAHGVRGDCGAPGAGVSRHQRPRRRPAGCRVGPGCRTAGSAASFRVPAIRRRRHRAGDCLRQRRRTCCWREPRPGSGRLPPASRSAPDGVASSGNCSRRA